MSGYRYAFSLSKEEVREATPPGTVTLIDNELVRTVSGVHNHEEKHIHLQPEPSPDPADPLNFSKPRKYAILAAMSLYAFVTNVSSSIFASALPSLITAWATFPEHGPPTGLMSFSTLTHLIAVNVLMLGIANIWWVPLGNTFGRRPVILFCLLMLTATSAWCGASKSYASLLAGRTFQGMAGGAADTIAPDIVGEIFFLHERGRALAIYTIFLTAGSLFGGLVGGYVTASLGWRWCAYIPAILAAALFVFCFFFQPETMFDRSEAMAAVGHRGNSVLNEKTQTSQLETVTTVSSRIYQPFTFTRSLKLATYRPGLLKRFFQPYLTLRLPGVWMVMLHYAGLLGGIVTISTMAPQLLAAPPYLWGQNVGLINVGGLIGTVLGGIYTYLLTDWTVKRQARHEGHGYSEPESRLPTLFPALLIATGGMWTFGFCAQNPGPKMWIGLEFGMGMLSFGLMQIPSVGFTYLLRRLLPDGHLLAWHRELLVDLFVGTWVESDGPAEAFGIFGMLMGLFALLTIPQYIFGKRTRIATAQWLPKESHH
ncbi:hypothetical protein H2203_000744 [Taxawa tesnikishii (nom. ined.)]|nr:hypothetical protein H2203_000744 [Dothideales sp. JES 119]